MNVLWLTAGIFFLDQASKYAIKSSLTLYQSIPIIPDFFNLTFVTNNGIAFGINIPGGFIIFKVLHTLMTIGLIWYIWQERKSHILVRVSLALILAGALGNLYDRLIYGKVVDFLDFMIGDYHWYIFNIADSAVTIGMMIYIYYTFIIENKTPSIPDTPS